MCQGINFCKKTILAKIVSYGSFALTHRTVPGTSLAHQFLPTEVQHYPPPSINIIVCGNEYSQRFSVMQCTEVVT